jgi:transitional endoplasmic reticulum ATPase
MEEVVLKVAEALQTDYGKRIIRLDSATRERLSIGTGDIVEIKGKRSAAAIALPAHPPDEGIGIIRMDGILRQGVGVGLGDRVRINKAVIKQAKKIVLAPTAPTRFAPGFDQLVKKNLIGKPFQKSDTIYINIFGSTVTLSVVQTLPQGLVLISIDTEVVLKEEPLKEAGKIALVSYEDVGGIKDQVQKIREMIELPLRHPELFERLGIEPPKGVLLYGSPGTGKTLLAKAVANESEAHFITIAGPEIISKYVGEAEERLRNIFKEAEDNAPSIIFIDEIDAIAPKREEVIGEVERRVVAQILSLMDGLKSRGQVIVIAASNRPNALDPALRRPGRFDREIEIGVPNKKGRLEILQIHTRGMPLNKEVDLEEIASITHGFVGADLLMLCKEAAISVLKRMLKSEELKLEEEAIPASTLEKMIVTKNDFENALKEIRPSALREVYFEIPNVKWSEIGGLEEAKRELKEAVELPLKKPEVFEKMGIRPVKGILLYGPPGTGKTLLAKAVANESEANFIAIRGPELISKWVGDSERGIREVFRKARSASPCIIFFDEIDALVPPRGSSETLTLERTVNQMLSEMDGIQNLKDVVIIGATNRVDMIDTALLRPGRFDKLIFIPLPEISTREEILNVHTKGMPLNKNVNLKEMAKQTEGFSGADLEDLCREAGMEALREKSNEVSMNQFKKALISLKPSMEQKNKEIKREYS